MSLGFNSGSGGTNTDDFAVISYNARPTAISVVFWAKGRTVGNVLVADGVAENDPSWLLVKLHDDNSGAMAPQIKRQFSTTNLDATGNGRAYPSTWQFWAAQHDGSNGANQAVFTEPAGGNVDFVQSQTNGSGTVGTTSGTLRIGFDSNALQGGIGGQLAELAIFDRLLSAQELSALQAGGNPMAAAGGPPVWYNRLRTNGTGTDAQVGTVTQVSGAGYVSTDNPTVDDPPAGVTKAAVVTLVDANGAPRANLTGLKWAWWDGMPWSGGPFKEGGAVGTTDANGVFAQPITTAHNVGETGYLLITDSDGTTTQNPNAFAAPVAVGQV